MSFKPAILGGHLAISSVLLAPAQSTQVHNEDRERATPVACAIEARRTNSTPRDFIWFLNIRIGLALASRTFSADKPVLIHLYADNPLSTPSGVFTSTLDEYAYGQLDLFDQTNHRLAHPHGDPKTWTYNRNLGFPIPPKTCFTTGDHDFNYDLKRIFNLAPGAYRVRIRHGYTQSTLVPSGAQKKKRKGYERADRHLKFVILSR